MQLTDSDIEQFKRIYEAETRETLTTDEARDAANRLYGLLELIREATPRFGPRDLAKLRDAAKVNERAVNPIDQTIS